MIRSILLTIMILASTIAGPAERRSVMTAPQRQDIEKIKALTEKMLYVPTDPPEGTGLWLN